MISGHSLPWRSTALEGLPSLRHHIYLFIVFKTWKFPIQLLVLFLILIMFCTGIQITHFTKDNTKGTAYFCKQFPLAHHVDQGTINVMQTTPETDIITLTLNIIHLLNT